METSRLKQTKPKNQAQSMVNFHLAPELSVIVPTFNEANNIKKLISCLRLVLVDIHWEVIFVDDDSPDKTYEIIRNLGQDDLRIRCIRRIKRRGLSGACIEGMLASQARYIAIMDGDLQHDEKQLPIMLNLLREKTYNLIIASRYQSGAKLINFSQQRTKISKYSTYLTQRLLGVSLKDPLSGFFMLRRDLFEEIAPCLKTTGFKILLDIITTAKDKLSIMEIPYEFKAREFGTSKLNAGIMLDFVSLFLNKLTIGFIPTRFLLYHLVGLLGLGLHLFILENFLHHGLKFESAQILTTIMIIACNFIFNNSLTYGDQRLTGKAFLIGLVQFELICSLGAISNVSVASYVYDMGSTWWLAGFGGALMSAGWNYLVSAHFVWRH